MNRILLFLFFSIFGLAQKQIKVEASKTTVEVGEVFELVYTFSSSGLMSGLSNEEILFPNFRGFRELGTSQSSSISIINGKTSAETSYIKTLQATQTGVFSIGPAKIKGKNKQISNALVIKVIETKNKLSKQSLRNNGIKPNTNNDTNTFVQWELEKKNPYLYEGVLLKLKLYTKDTDLIGSITEIKPPKFEGFITHTLKDETPSVEIERINGEEFATVILMQNIIFPQTTGQVKIESASVGFSSYTNIYSNGLSYIHSNPISFIAKPLPPNAPKNFGGAVGQLKLISSIDKPQLKKGESLSYEIEIIGTGNFDLIKMPEIQLNDSIEVFSPKERQAFEVTKMGLKGKNVITYLLVPQFKGRFKIPSVSFSYFDPNEAVYKTIQSNPQFIQVLNQSILKTNKNSIQNARNDQKEMKNKFLMIFSIVLIVLLLVLIIYLLNSRKKIKKEKQESVLVPQIIESMPNKQPNEKWSFQELQDLANEDKAQLYYEKKDQFINDWLLAKTLLPQSKLTIELAKEYFLSNGSKSEDVHELEVLFNQSKEAKYASIFRRNHVNLNEDFNQLIHTINKF